mmetsp:Transcript_45441/g.106079  ORF Transcript_45441/g.106079 Transcript_45441/m.106079 type:complete len:126 (-) Transcript_45441:276-653(-)
MNPLSTLVPSRFLLACDGESRISGFGQLREQGDLWELASLFVEKSSRGQGVGSALVQRLLTRHESSAAAGKPVYLLTLQDKSSFYRRHGFAVAPPPGPLQFEAALGKVIAKLATGQELICMRYPA